MKLKIDESMMKIISLSNKIEKSTFIKNGFAIFGAGEYTRVYLLPTLESKGYIPEFIIDTYSTEDSVNGYKVYRPDILKRVSNKFILLSGQYYASMYLNNMDCDNTFISQRAISDFFVPYFEDFFSFSAIPDINDLNNAISIFDDSLSKKIFLKKIFYYLGKEIDFNDVCEDDLYFPVNLMNMIDYKVFVDCGAYIGDTFEIWLDHVKKMNNDEIEYYGFEPSNFHADLQKTIDSVDMDFKRVARKLAVGDQRKKSLFINSGEMSRVFYDHVDKHDSEVDVTTLDDFCAEYAVCPTCIKMDIEGYELNAIIGSQEVMKRYKPSLIITVYHKANDIIEIPLKIKEINPDYKFFLRHHGRNVAETVLYCV